MERSLDDGFSLIQDLFPNIEIFHEESHEMPNGRIVSYTTIKYPEKFVISENFCSFEVKWCHGTFVETSTKGTRSLNKMYPLGSYDFESGLKRAIEKIQEFETKVKDDGGKICKNLEEVHQHRGLSAGLRYRV